MGKEADGRGSEPQRHLFKLAQKLYKNYQVIYEQYIPELGQRFDIFIIDLGIAIEYDGRQHYEFIEHFHKDINGYINAKKLDSEKEKFSVRNGIKIVRLEGDVSQVNSNDLKKRISEVGYPESEYDSNIFAKQDRILAEAREYRKKRYTKGKEALRKMIKSWG